jgi:small subunit ribosomal protein S4
VIALRERSQNLAIVNEAIENNVSRPAYVTFDDTKKTGSLVRLPERGELEPEVDESLVVEYYNQKL